MYAKNSPASEKSLQILVAGIVVLLSLLPVARSLSLTAPGDRTPLLAIILVEAVICLTMLAGRIRCRIAALLDWQASQLADALHAGRLEI